MCRICHTFVALKTEKTDLLLETSAEMSFEFIKFVVFVALRPKSTAMVMAGRSVHLSTLFPGQT